METMPQTTDRPVTAEQVREMPIGEYFRLLLNRATEEAAVMTPAEQAQRLIDTEREGYFF